MAAHSGKDFSSSVQPCCLNSLVRISGQMVSRFMELSGVELALTPSLPLLEADPEEIQRVLMQLLFQALESEMEGALGLATGLSETDPGVRLAWAGLATRPNTPAQPIQASFQVDLQNWHLILPLPVLPSA